MNAALIGDVTTAVGAGRPFDLGEDAVGWRVLRGIVEVFAVVDRSEHHHGSRTFVGAFHAGDLLFGGMSAEGGFYCHLLAFSGDAVLARIDADVTAVTSPAAAKWLEALSRTVTDRLHDAPSHGTTLVDGETVAMVAGDIVRARTISWLQVDSGTVSLFDNMRQPLTPGRRLALPPGAWVAAGDTGAVLVPAAPGGTEFQRAALSCLAHCISDTAAAEAVRVVTSNRDAARRLTGARQQFAGILAAVPGRSGRASGEDAFGYACQLVVEALGHAALPPSLDPHDDDVGMVERIVRRTRLPVRETTLYGGWWREGISPMIGRRADDGGIIALLPDAGGRYSLHDAEGNIVPFGRGDAIAVRPTAYAVYATLPERPLKLLDLVRFAVRGSQRDLFVVGVTAGIGAVLGLAIPVAVGTLIDSFIPGHLRWQVIALGLMLMLISLVASAVSIAGDLAELRLSGRCGSKLAPAIVDRILRLPTDLLRGFSSAELSSKILVVDHVRRAISSIAVHGLLISLSGVASLALLFAYAPAVALAAITGALLFIGAAVLHGNNQFAALREASDRSTVATQLSYQFVESVAHLRSAAAEERAFAQWSGVYASVEAALLRVGLNAARFSAVSATYALLSLAVLFGCLTWLRPADSTTGDVVVIIAAFIEFIGATMMFSGQVRAVSQLRPRLRTLRPVLEAQPEIDDSRLPPPALSGRIDVSNLAFSYARGAPPILEDIDLTIEPGQFVALVGTSGGGKSTMVRLLLGFERPDRGTVSYDGLDLQRLDLRAVRRQIGVVLQNDKLLPGSIAENILGVSGGTTDVAWEAARRAGLAGDIEAMPMGMHTVLAGSTTLSGGQTQRLLIARALAAGPRILFMDEATSALDNRTQAIVIDSLQRMAITRIVIAHRLSTIEHADKIIVFANGRIAQTGTYQELMARDGVFADLAKRQLT